MSSALRRERVEATRLRIAVPMSVTVCFERRIDALDVDEARLTRALETIALPIITGAAPTTRGTCAAAASSRRPDRATPPTLKT